MGRASGRKMPREIKPGTPEGDYIGLSDRQTPGPDKGYDSPIKAGPTGGPHITNHPTVRQQVPVPEPKPEYRGVMEHGVPADFQENTRERADQERGPNIGQHSVKPVYKDARHKPEPVPVYIVQLGGGTHPLKKAVVKHVLVNSMNGSDPILICGRDLNRTKVRLCNTDSTNNIRIAQDPTALVADVGSGSPPSRTIGGAIIAKGMTGYQDIETQDELWAVNTAASGTTVELSIILEYSVPAAG